MTAEPISPGMRDLLLLALAWAGYFLMHSLLASIAVKRRVATHWPALMPAYRLGFNALSLLLLAAPLWLALRYEGPLVLMWPQPLSWLRGAFVLAALFGLVWSLRYYDMREFLGIRQWRHRERCVEDQEHFHISPLHRFVRHPWYSLALIVVWCRNMNAAMLLSSLAITAYILVGSRLEERKLIRYHGEAYRIYRDRVPGLIPLPWRFLDQTTAIRLQRQARCHRDAARPVAREGGRRGGEPH